MAAVSAQAANIDTGNPDLTIRWDNTVKYTAAVRVHKQDQQVVAPSNGNVSVDDGDRAFKQGDMTSNRGDLLSEFDLDYKKEMGFRVSAAAWYDQVYNQNNANTSPSTNNNLGHPTNHFPGATRTLHGKDLELLDAFAYRNVDLPGNQHLSIRAGRHSLLYGESLFWGGNAIAGTQSPVDVVKALSVPNAQFKEIIMPVGQISATYQINSKLSIGGFYQVEDRKERDPASGSYFAFADFYDWGGHTLLVAPGAYFNRGKNIDGYHQGQGGAELKWKASDNWEFGFYGVNYHARSPKFYIRPGAVTPTAYGVSLGNYDAVYPQDIHAYAASFATLIGDTNVSGEFGVHTNQPLAGGSGDFIVDPLGTGNGSSNPLYPVGKTFHGNMSAITLFPASPLWEGAAMVGEIAYNRLLSVDNHLPLDPHVTDEGWAAWLNFEPSYFQVLPGLDVTLPITATYVFGGRSPLGPSIYNFIGQNSGSVTFAVTGTYFDRYKASLQYTMFYGPKGAFANGPDNHYSYLQQWADRDYVALTLSTSF